MKVDYKQENVLVIVQSAQTILSLAGLVGSILSFFIYNSKRLRTASYSFYYRIMSVSDIFLLIHSFRHWAKLVLNYDLSAISPLMCKLSEYQRHVTGHFSFFFADDYSHRSFIHCCLPKSCLLYTSPSPRD